MRAALFQQINATVTIENVECMPPRPSDILVRVTAAGVCHSDLSVVDGGIPNPGPHVLGHEACGVVEWVGSEVSGVGVGDLVLTPASPMCALCWYCLNGHPNLCSRIGEIRNLPRVRDQNGRELPAMVGIGAFAELMTVDAASVIVLSTELPHEQVCLLGCGVQTGMGAVLNAGCVRPGMSVAIIGCGGVGLSAVQAARISGAAVIIAIDPLASRRKAALEFGATHSFDGTANDLADQVRDMTTRRGADVVLDIVGSPETFALAIELTRRGGRTVLVGAPRPRTSFELDAHAFFIGEKHLSSAIFGSANIRRDVPRYIALAESGRLDLASMVTSRVALDDVDGALALLARGEGIRQVVTTF